MNPFCFMIFVVQIPGLPLVRPAALSGGVAHWLRLGLPGCTAAARAVGGHLAVDGFGWNLDSDAIPSGKRLQSYGTSPFLMGKSTKLSSI
jgi:hypothetical protein